MSLRVRMLLVGAVVPVIAQLAAALMARVDFARDLLRSIDDNMRNQAAVEVVSMFDRPGHLPSRIRCADVLRTAGTPHLHLSTSPLAAGADPSSAAVYDERGVAVARWPEDAAIPDRVVPDPRGATPSIRTVRDERGARRELLVSVLSPEGDWYALWLGHDLRRYDETVASYDRAGLLFVSITIVVLFGILTMHAQWLTRRIGALASHMAKLRDGDLEAVPPADPIRDRIGELRDSIADATAQLLAASRARDRLVADAAHELRTPLATMRAGIDVTLRRERSNVELRDQLALLRDEVDRLAAVAADLLEVASGARADEARVNVTLDEIVDAAIAASAGHATTRSVTLARSGRSGPVSLAPRAVRRAVDNLLVNAISHAPPRSTVDVFLERDADRTRVRVCDRGPGVPPADREAIFMPFHRVDRSRPGTGLGLAIVRDVARRHGGRAYAEAREGGGAEFVLEFPVAT